MDTLFKKVTILNKKEGETPLEALERFRRLHNKGNKKSKPTKMTYAGRLDPMASGLLILLAGEETKNKEKYLALDKEYEFEVLFGFATDTYDILGKVVKQDFRIATLIKQDLEKLIRDKLNEFTGTFIQKYPIYSSKTVKGKQLFEYARAGEEVDVPEREVFVKQFQFLKLRKVSAAKLLVNIDTRIKKVKGDFRQKEILKIWYKKLATKKTKEASDFFVASFKIKCGSGTYVRGIANSLGEKMNIPVLAFSIKRTKVGKWSTITI